MIRALVRCLRQTKFLDYDISMKSTDSLCLSFQRQRLDHNAECH